MNPFLFGIFYSMPVVDPKEDPVEVVVAEAGATAATGVIERPPAGLAAPPKLKPISSRLLYILYLKEFCS